MDNATLLLVLKNKLDIDISSEIDFIDDVHVQIAFQSEALGNVDVGKVVGVHRHSVDPDGRRSEWESVDFNVVHLGLDARPTRRSFVRRQRQNILMESKCLFLNYW